MHRGRQGQRWDDVEGVVMPAGGGFEGAAHRDTYCLGGVADELGATRQRLVNSAGEFGCAAGDRHALQRRVDVLQRLVWFQEEVTGDAHVGEPVGYDIE